MSDTKLNSIEQAKREKLRLEKPMVYDKIMQIPERHKNGIPTPIVDIAYSYACDLSCDHCTAWRGRWIRPTKQRKLTPADIRNFSDQAHDLGLAQFCLSGGEPTIVKELDEVILAMQPDKFHLTMSTHGHFLTKEKCKHLKELGLDKVKISLDDFDPKYHDANRRLPGAYQKATNAMFNAKEAGLTVVIQTVITHQNCQTPRIRQMAEFARKNGFTVDILVARPTGAWEGNYESLVTPEDADFLWQAHLEYPELHRDVWPSYGLNKGSGAVHSTLHLTQYGDIMPCVYIHISIGNIFVEPLGESIKRGLSIKKFAQYNPLCLSGEDRPFIEEYLSKAYGKELPIHWNDAFSEEDYISC